MPKTKRRKQFAALPFRAGTDGIEILLVTSRDTGRWVIPKGWPMKNRRPHRAAAIEAYEEAGVVGKADKTPLGTFDYEKRTETGAIACRVTVFPLPVSRLLDEWPERAERHRLWHNWQRASELVEEPELQAILRDFGRRAGKQSSSRASPAKIPKDERDASAAG
ncbi:NUDIX domain-containing protein [Aurantimonas aggregata]|uniref:NUDIX domain-containing protein n=1 Tax=Aurantimonas aggregata TaxID=2047720 RepID=A0A6L9MD24_9HYPH|nr:NUDIX hydrolase [Aurantimonas aggregata]NDV85432.1 NUDIX domain-containing protein [Aurantimonas aggregata]